MTGKSIIKNYVYSLAYQIIAIFVPVITMPYISRILQADGVGIYSYTNTIATIFSLFAALGINSYGQRQISYFQNQILERSQIFWELCITRIFIGNLVLISYLLFSLSYKKYTIFLLFQSLIIIAVIFDISWFFQGIENFKIVAVKNIVIKILSIILIFTVIQTKNDLGKYAAINGICTIFSNLIMLANLKGEIKRISIKDLNLKRHIRGNLEFFLPVIAVQMYSQVDKVMLGIISVDISQNGYYEQARKIILIIESVIISLNSVLFSRVSNFFKNGKDREIKSLYDKSFHYIIAVLVPAAIGLFVISDSFVMWFFGGDFTYVSLLLKFSCPLLVFKCLANFVGVQYLNATDQQNKGTLIYMFSAVLNIILNVILIPRFLSIGAVIASNIAEAFSCGLQIYLLLHSKYVFDMRNNIWHYILSGTVMGCIIFALNSIVVLKSSLLLIVDVLVGVLIYTILLLLMKDSMVIMLFNKLKFKMLIRDKDNKEDIE